MSGIDYFSFEGDGATIGPHRPSLDDIGGDEKINDTAHPPGPEGPSAEEWNERARLIAAMAMICPTLAVTVDFASGAPFYAKFWCINSTVESTTVTLADNGVGDTSITYPASKLPASKLDPIVVMNENTAATSISAEFDEATRTIRVRTWDESSAAGVDTRFTMVFR
jgi:hypothetical protein